MPINYAEVVADIRDRAAKLIASAEILESFMSPEELAPVAQPTVRSTAKRKDNAHNFEEFLERKKSKYLPSNLPTVRDAVMTAITEGRKTPAELSDRVSQLRPGTVPGEVPKTAFYLRKKALIHKSSDGFWVLTETEPEAAAELLPHPTGKPESISELVRRVASESIQRTAPELTDRILELRPDTKRDSVSTIIGQLVTKGDLRKIEGLKVRPVVDGRIQYGNGAHA